VASIIGQAIPLPPSQSPLPPPLPPLPHLPPPLRCKGEDITNGVIRSGDSSSRSRQPQAAASRLPGGGGAGVVRHVHESQENAPAELRKRAGRSAELDMTRASAAVVCASGCPSLATTP
jgi:hypothetical protein